jgi:hypothetical protein
MPFLSPLGWKTQTMVSSLSETNGSLTANLQWLGGVGWSNPGQPVGHPNAPRAWVFLGPTSGKFTRLRGRGVFKNRVLPWKLGHMSQFSLRQAHSTSILLAPCGRQQFTPSSLFTKTRVGRQSVLPCRVS